MAVSGQLPDGALTNPIHIDDDSAEDQFLHGQTTELQCPKQYYLRVNRDYHDLRYVQGGLQASSH